MTAEFRFVASIWAHHGDGAWHFLTLPAEVAEDLRDLAPPARPGFGSIRVTATVGSTTWETSVFPDKTSGSYVLPIKRSVRRANDLADGDSFDVTLQVQRRGRSNDSGPPPSA